MEEVRGAPPPLLQCLIRPAATFGYAPGKVLMKEGGAVDYYGMTVSDLLMYAKERRSDRMVAPPWFDVNRYDVSITVPAGREDLRDSLIEQTVTSAFSLKTRNESRPVSVYLLGGKGAKLHASSAVQTRGLHVRPGQFTGVATPVALMLGMLEGATGGIEVVDETGLTGNYDFDLSWEKGNLDSLQTTLHDQLGLTLTQETRLRDFLIVEDAVLPTTW